MNICRSIENIIGCGIEWLKGFLNEGERRNDIFKVKHTKTRKPQRNKTHDLGKYYYRKR